MKYPTFLQIYRRRAKLTQIELAKMLGEGVTQTTISNWETGVSLPSGELKNRLAEILGVKEKSLFPF